VKISELLLQNKNFKRTIQGIFEILYYFYLKTIKFKQIGKFPEKKALFCFWHRTFFPLIYFYRNKNISILLSPSRDGELLAKPLRKYGFLPLRGSSSKLGEKGLKDMVKTLKRGKFGAITPDGPRGPREIFKEGALYISYLSKTPIYLVGVAYNRKIELKSWDKFMIPLPFSKCAVYISSPIFIYNKNMIDSELFTNLLKEANKIARRYIKRR